MKSLEKLELDPAVFGELDAHLMHEGKHPRLYEKLGAQLTPEGTRFLVWAPHADAVSVIGDWNDWKKDQTPLERLGDLGVWIGTIAGVGKGARYKYHIVGPGGTYTVDKTDPFAFRHEPPPQAASIVWELDYAWGDAEWVKKRSTITNRQAPISIYEVHLGSWMRVPEEENRPLSYREIAPKLVAHVKQIGFTHVELLPITEHPFYGSWGYETTGYFAATGRYGTPEDLMFLIDALHQADVGVILDWVPGHFPTDEYGLVYFDGTPLYEHPDRRRGFHPEWQTALFNYGKTEVQSFLLSSAMFWLDRFHADGLRVDGVASMLYLDYGRKPGEWLPNERGGHENLDAVELLQHLNEAIHRERGETVTIAEESTAWPRVTGPRDAAGLGFDFKWDLGWMHDTLAYLAQDPINRRWHHNDLTMRGLYVWTEAFVLPLSHDEVVHGKGSLIGKMPGDRWQQFANLRLLYAYMWSLPGKKLLFMGGEFAQYREWNHDASLDWHLLGDVAHRQVQLLVGELNRLYRFERALHELDCDPAGYHWIVPNDSERSVLVYERWARNGEVVLVALNFTPVPRENYRIGVPTGGVWEEIMNTDAVEFGGSGIGNLGGLEATPVRAHGRELSLSVYLPPLGALFLRRRPTRTG